MKIRYILTAGAIAISALVPVSCSFAKGESEIKLMHSLVFDEHEGKEEKIEVNDYVYTTKRVNIRFDASEESEILLTAEAGTKLNRGDINIVQGWDLVLINEEQYYVYNEYLTKEEPAELAKPLVEQLNDLRYMSAIVWAEAGNQCEAGQQAVGIVVMNRVESEIYEDTIYEVINEPNQFSPATNGLFSEALDYYDSGMMPKIIIDAAKYSLQGNKTINYDGKTYNLENYLYFSRWVDNSKLVIQDHMFK